MMGNNQKQVSIRPLLLFIGALISIIIPILSSMYQPGQAYAATPTGVAAWISNAPGAAQIAYNDTVFTQQTITNGMMTLFNQGACPNQPDIINVGHAGDTLDYHTTKIAIVDILQPGDQGCTEASHTTVNLINTYNTPAVEDMGVLYGAWISDNNGTNGAPSRIKIINTGDVYTQTSINNGTMTLTGPSPDQAAKNCEDAVKNGAPNNCLELCKASNLSIGDSTNTYVSATGSNAATLSMSIFNEQVTNGHGSCHNVTKQVTILNSFAIANTTGHWNIASLDPNAAIIIDSVSAADKAYAAPGDTYLEANKNPITNKTDMLLLYPNASKDSHCAVDKAMHVNPYTTSQEAIITVQTGANCGTVTVHVGLTNIYGSTTTGTPGTTNPAQGDGCPVPADDGWRWFSCPIFGVLELFTQAMYGIVTGMATIPVGVFFSPDAETVFNIFRNLGLGILAIAGLLMAYNEVIGRDAYRVRKTAPAIFGTAVAIALVWPVAKWGAGFINDITFWGGRIFFTIGGSVNSAGVDGQTIIGGFADSVLALIGGTALFAVLGLFGVLSLLLSGGVALLFACVVFAARLAILFALLLASPLLLSLNALEFSGPKKVAKFGGDAAIVTAIVGPAATGLLGVTYMFSHLFAHISSVGGQITAILIQVFGIGSVIVVPRWVGGAIGAVHGLIDGTRGQTVGGWLRNGRARIAANNINALRAGSRYNTDDPLGRRFNLDYVGRAVNWTGGHIGAGPRSFFGLGARGRSGRMAMTWTTPEAASKLDPKFAALSTDPDAMAAIAFGNNPEALDRLSYYHNEPTRVSAAIAKGSVIQATPQMQIAAALALAQSGKNIGSIDDVRLVAHQAGHGIDAQETAVKEGMQYIYRSQSGRADLGRDDINRALGELNAQTIASQKSDAVQALFGPRAGRGLATTPGGATTTGAGILEALDSAGDHNRRQHFVDLLYGLQYNTNVTPDQQQWIASGIRAIQSHPQYGTGQAEDLWKNAVEDYASRIRSDIRLKKDVQHLCTVEGNIKLYSFRYIWGGPTYVGVMAQDLLKTHPDAVHVTADGYYAVDYAALGVPFTTLADWQTAPDMPSMGVHSKRVSRHVIKATVPGMVQKSSQQTGADI